MIKCMAKKKTPRGRPKLPKGESKASVVTIRFQPADRKAVDAAAKSVGQSLSEWIRLTLLTAVNQSNMNGSETDGVGIEPHR